MFYILAVILLSNTLVSEHAIALFLKMFNKIFFLAGLFCIGTQIDKDSLKDITIKPLLLSLRIWCTVIPASLWAVMSI